MSESAVSTVQLTQPHEDGEVGLDHGQGGTAAVAGDGDGLDEVVHADGLEGRGRGEGEVTEEVQVRLGDLVARHVLRKYAVDLTHATLRTLQAQGCLAEGKGVLWLGHSARSIFGEAGGRCSWPPGH